MDVRRDRQSLFAIVGCFGRLELLLAAADGTDEAVVVVGQFDKARGGMDNLGVELGTVFDREDC